MKRVPGSRLGPAAITAIVGLAAALVPVTPAAGRPRHVVPKPGFFAGRSADQLVVAASRNRLMFVNLAVAAPRACHGRVYGGLVSVSRGGRFHGRGSYDAGTHETFSGGFLSSSEATGAVTRVQYGSAGSVICRASARFDVRWRRPL